MVSNEGNEHFDAFISHASEDKEFVEPLVLKLEHLGLKIWYDDFSLHIGDSLSGSIDKGLLRSNYAIVIVSKKYCQKSWTKLELQTLITRQVKASESEQKNNSARLVQHIKGRGPTVFTYPCKLSCGNVE